MTSTPLPSHTPPLPMPAEYSLLNKTALVTGSTRGIGRATALKLAERGASVAIHYTSPSSTSLAESLAQEIAALPGPTRKTCIICADLTSPDRSWAPRMIREALTGLGVEKLDVLINNAGRGPEPTPATEWNEGELDMAVDVFIKAPILLVKEFVPCMVPEGGRIVNISSIAAKMPSPTRNYYSLTKAALEAMTVNYAVELAKPYKCTVNAVRIGATNTVPAGSEAAKHAENLPGEQMTDARKAARQKVIEATSAASRLGELDDVVQPIVWLCSDAARWINGQVINANGGFLFN